jgi:AbrB family looped-hinge helix DNA binding protein
VVIMAQPRPIDATANQATIRTRGQITLPAEVRLELGLRDGDHLIVTVADGQIILTPAAIIPRDQRWYWTPEWQAGERQADVDIAAGHGRVYRSDEDFLAALDAAVDDPSTVQ